MKHLVLFNVNNILTYLRVISETKYASRELTENIKGAA